MKMLETPPTLRAPRPDEIPRSESVLNRLKEREIANITEGFTLKYNTSPDPTFLFYVEINIDNSRLWKLFIHLALHLPEEISLIFNHSDAEPLFGRYMDKHSLLETLEQFKVELTQDCFLEFGAIHHTGEFLEEVFVDSTKYIKYWGSDEEWFRKSMAAFDIHEAPNLDFVDEFPMVREALRLHISGVKEPGEIIPELSALFCDTANN